MLSINFRSYSKGSDQEKARENETEEKEIKKLRLDKNQMKA